MAYRFIVGVAQTIGHRGMGGIGDFEHLLLELVFDVVDSGVQFLDALAGLAHGGNQFGGVLTALLEAGYFG